MAVLQIVGIVGSLMRIVPNYKTKKDLFGCVRRTRPHPNPEHQMESNPFSNRITFRPD